MSRTAYIIAGHSNKDTGAVGFDGERESEVTKRFRDKVVAKVRELNPNINIYVDNDSLSLIEVINDVKGKIKENDLLVDYHVNASSSPSATGIEVFIADDASSRSYELAFDLLDTMEIVTFLKNRGIKKESNSNRRRLGILRMKGRAALVELYFNSNESDTKTFKENEDRLAHYHAAIILKHLYI